MKALLLLLTAAILTLTGCVAGPYSYGYNSYGSSFSYQTQSYQPAQQTYYSSNRPYLGYGCNRNVVVGPQYYKGTDYGYGYNNVQYKNYSNAPLVIRRPGASTMIIPKSWD